MNNERGFTLTELLVAMALISTVVAGVLVLQNQGQIAYLIGSARAEVQQSGRVALDRMVRELREGTQIINATGCDAGMSDITFVYFDGTYVGPSPNLVTVRYYLNGSKLERVQTAPAAADDVIIGGLQTLTIRCYDANSAPTATAANVRSVDITLVTQIQGPVTAGTPQNQHDVVTSRVRLRNLL